MKTKIANSLQLDIVGNRDCSTDRDILTATLKRWRQKLGYCSIFAAVPAILASHISEARSDEPKKPEASVAERNVRRLDRLNKSFSSPALLKRQSEFRLPDQEGSFDTRVALGGTDDCPGRTIPGGTYTAAAPFTDSGDTSGANSTVNQLHYYYYYTFDALGPDHVYSFTLTGRGPNPQIEVSTTSGTYKPMVYVLQGGFTGACPAGTGNLAYNALVLSYSSGNTATLNSWQMMNYIPLYVPLHLFVDSAKNDASGSGPYTIRMQDVTIAPAVACPDPNSLNCPEFFVRQQYLDFLNRDPDSAGNNDWLSVLYNCRPNQGGLGSDPYCDRVEVSSGFFRSQEFGERGYWLYRFFAASLGRRPQFAEFLPESQKLSGQLTAAELAAKKADFIARFMQLPEFTNIYAGLTDASHAAQFIAKLEEKAHVTLPASATTGPGQPPQYGRQQLISLMSSGQFTAAQTLQAFIEQKVVWDANFYPAFVAMEYFGYLRRDPDTAGYNDWVDVLTNGRASAGILPGDYRHLIFGFIYSVEYRQRFGQP
jgi:hypothetical protein